MNVSLSNYLNLLRFLAALAVYLFHAQHFAKVRIPYIGNLGNEAVFVFFVLSGMLITYSGMRQPSATRFLRARLVRLWSVCLPALALTLVADTVGQHMSLQSYIPMQPYDAFKWIASIGINALFLNQIWNANIYLGTNGPFWSLSYEFWYYMVFAAALYFKRNKRLVAVAATMLIAGPKILVGLPVWLMGAAVYVATRNRSGIPGIQGWLLWLGSIVAACAFLAFDMSGQLSQAFPLLAKNAAYSVNFWPESYLVGALVAWNIYAFSLCAKPFTKVLATCSPAIRLGADVSFGLYLFHYPLMYLTKAFLNSMGLATGWMFATTLYAAPFLLSAVLALYCERRKEQVAARLDWVTSGIRNWLGKRTKEIAALGKEDPLLPSHPSADGILRDD